MILGFRPFSYYLIIEKYLEVDSEIFSIVKSQEFWVNEYSGKLHYKGYSAIKSLHKFMELIR